MSRRKSSPRQLKGSKSQPKAKKKSAYSFYSSFCLRFYLTLIVVQNCETFEQKKEKHK